MKRSCSLNRFDGIYPPAILRRSDNETDEMPINLCASQSSGKLLRSPRKGNGDIFIRLEEMDNSRRFHGFVFQIRTLVLDHYTEDDKHIIHLFILISVE